MTDVRYEVLEEDGRTHIKVPWEEADELRAKLAEMGFQVTVVIRAAFQGPEALIEPWPGVDHNAVLYALNEMAMA